MICYMPNLGSILWERKSQITFDSVEDLKGYVAERLSVFKRFVGHEVYYRPHDVEFRNFTEHDVLTGWSRRCDIVIGDRVVGYCNYKG